MTIYVITETRGMLYRLCVFLYLSYTWLNDMTSACFITDPTSSREQSAKALVTLAMVPRNTLDLLIIRERNLRHYRGALHYAVSPRQHQDAGDLTCIAEAEKIAHSSQPLRVRTRSLIPGHVSCCLTRLQGHSHHHDPSENLR